ncbi:MAG: mobile mystery protein A [Bdellovibrionota bacterium]
MAHHNLALKQIEARFKGFNHNLFKVEQGWIRQTREALGMTLSKLGKVCGVSTPTISQAERREADGKVTVETLKKTAEAMNCEFIYMFVPKSEMTAFIEEKAYEKAKRILMNADLHMSLEDQKVKGDLETKIQRLKNKLIDEGKVW